MPIASAQTIGSRVEQALGRLIKAVLLDSGDTLVDEATEQFDAGGYVVDAELIPGAYDMVNTLAGQGYPLVLVADGRVRSFDAVLGRHGMNGFFHARIISETLGCEKPDPRMFMAALAALGLGPLDASHVVMVGNNLERDIAGANRCGLISIWESWSKRRSHVPANFDEVPDYTMASPAELPGLLVAIEKILSQS